MSQQNNTILPSLQDYSVLSNEDLEHEIGVCRFSIKHWDDTMKRETRLTLESFRERLMLAEKELERRYLLS
jgi:hypothetical protein